MEYLKVFDTVANQTAFRMGENYEEPHVSCLSNGANIKYNRNYVENLWVDNEYTNPLPDKLLLLNGNRWWWDIMYLNPDVSIDNANVPQNVQNAVQNFDGAYELTDATKNQLGWQIFDIDKVTENLIENNSDGNWAFFLWKIPGPTLTIGEDDSEGLMYVFHIDDHNPRWTGGTYWATTNLVLKIGNDYYVCFTYTPD